MTHGHPYTGSMLGVQLFSCINAGYVIPVQNAFVCGRDRQFLQPCASDDLAVGKITVKRFGKLISLDGDFVGHRQSVRP